MGSAEPQVDSRLAVREEEAAFFVVRAEDPEDWLVRFEKCSDFPAREWAENDWRFEWVHDGEVVVCPWHGLEYHVPTGRCLAYPNIKLRRYEVVVESGKVKVLL